MLCMQGGPKIYLGTRNVLQGSERLLAGYKNHLQGAHSHPNAHSFIDMSKWTDHISFLCTHCYTSHRSNAHSLDVALMSPFSFSYVEIPHLHKHGWGTWRRRRRTCSNWTGRLAEWSYADETQTHTILKWVCCVCLLTISMKTTNAGTFLNVNMHPVCSRHWISTQLRYRVPTHV